jgi:FKBP-type peptidyl-prolyl cis-trans isomerase (trigger factor)
VASGRGAQHGDTLIIDFEVRSKDTQDVIPGMTQERHELDCLAEENFLPGVMPQLMGMQVGEQSSFDFSFPDPWEPAELAGVEATVRPHTCTICLQRFAWQEWLDMTRVWSALLWRR